MLSRAQGVFLGQVSGDALGGLVRSLTPKEIRQKYPEGVRELRVGGVLNTLAGQPTTASEMAIVLACSLVEQGTYFSNTLYDCYSEWFESEPPGLDPGLSVALRGKIDLQNQGGGALMRVSSLGVFGANYSLDQVAEWAESDAMLTHFHPVVLQINILYAMAIATAVREELDAKGLYSRIVTWAIEREVDPAVMSAIEAAPHNLPADDPSSAGTALSLFHNALYRLLHAPNLVEGVVRTVMQGGDSSLYGAITGALLGAVYGKEGIPEQWTCAILHCRPLEGAHGVFCPRPRPIWPCDLLEIAQKLIVRS